MTPADLSATLKRLGLSQVEAAEVLGVHDRTMRKWLHGDRPIPQIAVNFLAIWEQQENSRSPHISA